MKAIDITLDVSKINKDKITERKYKDKYGNEITAKEYKIRLIPLKEKKFITKGNNWEMHKTHFVVESKQNKEEKDNFIGSGFEFIKNDPPRNVAQLEPEDVLQDNEMPHFENEEDIPF